MNTPRAFSFAAVLTIATAAVGNDEPTRQKDAVLEYLNSKLVLRWSETTLWL